MLGCLANKILSDPKMEDQLATEVSLLICMIFLYFCFFFLIIIVFIVIIFIGISGKAV